MSDQSKNTSASNANQKKEPSQTVPAIALPTNPTKATPTFSDRAKLQLTRVLTSASRKINRWLGLETVFLDIGFISLAMALVLANPTPLIIVIGIGIIGFLQWHLLNFAMRRTLVEETQLVFKDDGGSLAEETDSDVQGVLNWTVFYPLFINPEDLHSIYQLHRDRPEITQRSRNERILISLLGLTGTQRLLAVLANNLGIAYVSRDGSLKYIERKTLNRSFIFENLRDNLGRMLTVQAIMLIGLTLAAGWVAYFLWIASYLTMFSLLIETNAKRSENVIKSVETGAISENETAVDDTSSLASRQNNSDESAPLQVESSNSNSEIQARMMGVKSRIAKLRQSINSQSESLSKQLSEKLSSSLAKMRTDSKLDGVQSVESEDLTKDLDRPYSATELPVVDRLRAQSEEIQSQEKFYSLLVDEDGSNENSDLKASDIQAVESAAKPASQPPQVDA